MDALGITHIGLTIVAYIMYLFVFLKFLSKTYPYRLLNLANALYITGFALGMVWAVQDWGFALSFDPKIVISALVPIPFVVEGLMKRKDLLLVGLGCALIMLNYFLPLLLGTVHTH